MKHPQPIKHRPFEQLKPLADAHRAETLSIIDQIHKATIEKPAKLGTHVLRLNQLILTDKPTLPDTDSGQEHDAPEIVEPTPHRTRESYPQDRQGWLQYFRDTHAPEAIMTIEKGKTPEENYFRLVSYGANDAPEWAIAERNKLGNATYIWRRDRSPNPVDQALGGTKGQATQMSAERLYHPPGFDGTLDSEESDRFEQRLLDMLTREPQ